MIQQVREDLRRLLPDSQEGPPAARLRCVARGIASPGFQALLVYRFFHWAQDHHIPTQPLRYGIERLIEITTGISIPAEAELGPGLRIHHFGGIILHPKVKMGSGCTLYHGVTLGTDGQSDDAPTLGQDVLVGAGAKILGGIHLGDRCRVGANAVVTRSYGPDTVLVGVPARPVTSSLSREGARE